MKTTKTKVLLIILSLMAMLSLQAQYPGFEWALQVGGVGGGHIASDPVGNQIITGTFSGTVDFDPGSGYLYLTSAGGGDIFIQKLDGEGNLLWATSLGNENDDGCSAVATDAAGNIYLSGQFLGTLDADPGSGVYWLTATPTKACALVLKLEPDGDFSWARQFGDGESGYCWTKSISVDNDANVITVGELLGTADFDPGPGVYNLTSISSFNVFDNYIHKMDASGNFSWVKQLKGKEFHHIHFVITDAVGGIYYCGDFRGTVDFDPSVRGKYNLTAGTGWMNSFFGKLTANGDFAWAGMIYCDDMQNYAFALALDPAGNLYVAGDFGRTADFDPGPGVYYMNGDAGGAYILKLDQSGLFLWAGQHGSGTACIKTDAAGNLYVSGSLSNTADVDPGNGTYLLTSYGLGDGYVEKCNPGGDLQWVIQLGNEEIGGGPALSLDAPGNIYGVGGFDGTVDFNPDGNGIFEMSSTGGGTDMYILKLNPAGGSDCPLPNGLNATDISETSATLGWNAVTGATGYYVRYREFQTPAWTESALVTGTSLAIDGLAATTVYEFQVKTNCYSNYSYYCEFTTSGGNIDIYEPNEYMDSAALIPVNTEIFALIGVAPDLDWFTFSTTNDSKNVMISLTNLPANYNINLYKYPGVWVGGSSNPGTEPETILYNSRKSSAYYIKVYGVDGAFDPFNYYTLKAEISSNAYKSAEVNFEAAVTGNSLAICPNPAGNLMDCIIISAVTGDSKIAMINSSGQAVLSGGFDVNEGTNRFPVDVSTIPNGLYVIRIVINNEIMTQKVMIVH